MGCKQEVGFGIPERKSQFFQFFFYSFPGGDDLLTGLPEICVIFYRFHTRSQGCLIHGVGIKGILHIIQVPDQLCVSHGVTDAHSRKRTGLGKCLHHQQIIVFLCQRQCGTSPEINICLIHNNDHIRIISHHILDLLQRQQHACGSIGIGKDHSSIFFAVILFHNLKPFIQRLCLIGNAEYIRPHIIKRIGDIRKKDRLPAVKKGQKAHGQHII